MPLPTVSDVHVDQLLTNVSIGYTNEAYIADQILPILPVPTQTGLVPKVNQSAFFRNDARMRAPGTKSDGSGFTVDNSTKYDCPRYSFRVEIPDEVKSNAAAAYNVDRIATSQVTEQLYIAREVACAAAMFAASKWNSDQTVASQWSNYGAGDPVGDIASWRDTIQGSIGRDPNTLVIGRAVWTILKNHPDFIDRIKYTQGVTTPVSTALFASLCELNKVLVGNALYTTSKEGTAEASVSYSRIWGKNAVLLYAPAGPALETPAAGYTVIWNRVAGAAQYIKRMRDEEREVDIIESNSYFQHKLLETRAGTYCPSVVA